MGVHRITRIKKSLYISLLVITTTRELIMEIRHYIPTTNCIIHDSIFCIGCYGFCRKIAVVVVAVAIVAVIVISSIGIIVIVVAAIVVIVVIVVVAAIVVIVAVAAVAIVALY